MMYLVVDILYACVIMYMKGGIITMNIIRMILVIAIGMLVTACATHKVSTPTPVSDVQFEGGW